METDFKERNHWWDWLKLIAAFSMLLDHWRFVDPQAAALVWIGRLALPLFAVIAARNFIGSSDRPRYLLRLLPFGVAAELPFFLLTGTHGNILLLFLFAFFVFETGSIWPILASSCCAYGLNGLAGLLLLCHGDRKVLTATAGAIFNPWPFNLVSIAAALLPGLQVGCPPCPSFGRNWLLWFYPLHLVLYLALSTGYR